MSGNIQPTHIAQVKAQLAAKPEQAPKAALVLDGVDVAARIKQYESLLGKKPFALFNIVQNVPNNIKDAGKVTIRLTQQKNLLVEHIKNNAMDRTTSGIFFSTTHPILATIMNLFAYLFPCCVQGCAEFGVTNNGKEETCYVRRAYLQDALLKADIPRHAFNATPAENTELLKQAALKHFV